MRGTPDCTLLLFGSCEFSFLLFLFIIIFNFKVIHWIGNRFCQCISEEKHWFTELPSISCQIKFMSHLLTAKIFLLLEKKILIRLYFMWLISLNCDKSENHEVDGFGRLICNYIFTFSMKIVSLENGHFFYLVKSFLHDKVLN